MRVFLSAGEASGDAYAAALVEEMRRLGGTDSIRNTVADQLGIPHDTPDEVELWDIDSLAAVEAVMALENEFGIEIDQNRVTQLTTFGQVLSMIPSTVKPQLLFEGIGGKQLRAAGVKLLADTSGWGAISIVQALRVVPKVVPRYYAAKRALLRGQPGLFVPIDFGYLNIRLARHAKRHGWKVLYFMPPGSWRSHKQGGDLPQIADEIVTPFPWSAEILRKMGASVHWFGHPIKQLMRRSMEERPEIRRDPRRLAVLPGSRLHEIELNLPTIAEAIKEWPGTVEFAVAASVDANELRGAWLSLRKHRENDIFTQGDIYGVLHRAQAAIVCSGTATLEAALSKCPMVVMYRLSAGMAAEVALLRIKRPQFISLPNILLNRMAVPELVHKELDSGTLGAEVNRLLGPGPARGEQLKAFEELETLLGPDHAITKTAELALSMVGGQG